MSDTKMCTKCGQVKLFKEFYVKPKSYGQRKPYCKVCDNKIAERKAYTGNTRNRKNHSKLNRIKWLEFIHADRLSCCKCGYNKTFSALQFHHRDPSQKEFNICQKMTVKFTMDNRNAMFDEIAKCDVLCSNCHIELHEKLRNRFF